ncbi:alcohol dehydrogenase catalytic domain-containing protein [Kocuria sp. M1N1S27]|uniref:alcohol dehydrogenase catalytic domain-containing protein n=1 Tax=Kocuria kalidii TaxID=3376283 RepID=UPI0037894970
MTTSQQSEIPADRLSPSTATMRAARQHERGAAMVIDEIERPRATGTDVVVKVAACGMVPNLANVLANWEAWYPHEPLPPTPAIFGLDPVGVIHEVGEQVVGLSPGDRVYVNPSRSCGHCHACTSGAPQTCDYWAFAGYFGFTAQSVEMFRKYPHGGFSEYMLAPSAAIVPIPDNLDFRNATRLGYLGTGYSALKKLGPLGGKSVVVHGGTGTLGVGVTMLALALGASKVFAVARGLPLLERLKTLAPERIEVFSTHDGKTSAWLREQTGGHGADYFVDTMVAVGDLEELADAVHGVARGGKIVNIGGLSGPSGLDPKWFMDNGATFYGSAWFTTAEALELADMIRSNVADMGVFEPKVWPFEEINAAINGVTSGDGGFTSYLVEF